MARAEKSDESERFDFRREFEHVDLGDARRSRRLATMMENLADSPTAIVQRSQTSRAEMAAAYRFLGNDEVDPQEILRAHREKTLARMRGHKRVLAIQDTSTFCFSSLLASTGLGAIAQGTHGARKSSKGLFVHTALAVTPKGTPLGILGQTLWSRELAGEGHELNESERPRWLKGILQSAGAGASQVISVADREADGADYFASCRRQGVEFVVRAKAKVRVSDESGQKIFDELTDGPAAGRFELELRARDATQSLAKNPRLIPRKTRKARLEVRFGEFRLKRSKAIEPRPDDEELTVRAVLASEVGARAGDKPINWLLFTSLPVSSLADALDVIECYRARWEIEVFHKILKSGCEAEKARLGSAESLMRLLACLSVAAWRLHVLAKLSREEPDLPCTAILEDAEWKALVMLITKSKKLPNAPPTLAEATLMIAKLGRYLARKGDGPPGPKTLWEGWQKLIHCTEMYLVFNPD